MIRLINIYTVFKNWFRSAGLKGVNSSNHYLMTIYYDTITHSQALERVRYSGNINLMKLLSIFR